MNPIKISQVIQAKRREKGVTQEELAAYAGVSKAAVSKWENGQSYPDLALLPILAAYFNISIDDLIGYEPQMTKEDIRRLYGRLSKDFARKPFDEVYQECCHIIAKYYSCFPLILQMGILLLNHGMLCQDPERTKEIMLYTRNLFIRVKEESGDISLTNQALYLQAYSSSYLGDQQEVLDLLDGVADATISPEALTAQAWASLGNITQAAATLQKGCYLSLLNLCSHLGQILQYYVTDDYHFQETLARLEALLDVFDVETLHPSPLLSIYLNAANLLLQRNDSECAMKYIIKYAALCSTMSFPLKLTGDSYFNLLEEWIADLDLGSDAPRDSRLVQRDLAEVLISNPAFLPLQDRTDFKNAVRKIQNHFDLT